MTRVEIAWKQIQSAREYTLSLLNECDADDWFVMPAGLNTHLAWQVGHLAMAEYGLCLFRQRGREAEDRALMPGQFRKKYSRGSTPDPDASTQPTPQELLQSLDRIHHQVAQEILHFSDEQLDQPLEPPYAAYATGYGALLFCAHHEMLHAGQIGLIRRLLGKDPVR